MKYALVFCKLNFKNSKNDNIGKDKDYQILNSKYIKPNTDINIKMQDESALSNVQNDHNIHSELEKSIVNFNREKNGSIIIHDIMKLNQNAINCFDYKSRSINIDNQIKHDDENEKILQTKNVMSPINIIQFGKNQLENINEEIRK